MIYSFVISVSTQKIKLWYSKIEWTILKGNIYR